MGIRQLSVIQDLKEDIEHVMVRFFDFVKQNNGIRTASDGFRQLSAFVKSDVSWRRADQTRHAVFFHIFGHIDPDDGVFIVKEFIRKGFCQFGLTDASGSEENERCCRTALILQSGSGPEHGIGHRFHGFILTDHPLMEFFRQMQKFFPFGADQFADGDPGPAADDLGNVLLVDLFFQQSGTVGIAFLDLFFRGGDLFFDARNDTMLQFGGFFILVFAFRFGQIRLGELQAFPQSPQLGNALLFRFPLRPHGFRFFFLFGEFRRDDLRPFFAGGVFFLFQSSQFDLQTHGMAFQFIDFHRTGIDFRPQLGRGFVHQVDRLVRQESFRDIFIGKRGGSHQSSVTDLHAVMQLIAFLEAAQNGNGIFQTGLLDHDRLETAFQSSVFLDIFAVFIQGGGADAVQFATRQHGFEQVAGIHRTFRSARADHGMELINKQNDAAVGTGNFFQHSFQTFLEFAAVFGARDQGPHIEGNDPFVFQIFRHIAANDPHGQAFHDGGFAHTGFADQHRIVFGAAGKDLRGPPDLVVTADHGVEFFFPGRFGQVASVFFQRFKGRFRIFAGNPLISTDFLQSHQGFVFGAAAVRQHFAAGTAFFKHRQKKMFHADIFIFHCFGFVLRGNQQSAEFTRWISLSRSWTGNRRNRTQSLLGFFPGQVQIDIHFFQQGRDEALFLIQQGIKQVLGPDLLMSEFQSRFLSFQHCFTGFVGKFFHIHGHFSFV